MPSDIEATIAGLDALVIRVHDAMEQSVSDVAHMFQGFAMRNAPVGSPDNSTNAPGDLARSIAVEGPFGGDGTYYARVGPTVTTRHAGPGGRVYNYGRQREFGGDITPNVAGRLRFTKGGRVYFAHRVHQVGSHYLGRARADGQPFIERLLVKNLTIAVEGG